MSDAAAPAVVKTAQLHRMMMPDHTCPYGLKALDLLKRSGFAVEDHHLATREEVEAFKGSQGVATTPQIFIDDRRIGGLEHQAQAARPHRLGTRHQPGPQRAGDGCEHHVVDGSAVRRAYVEIGRERAATVLDNLGW